VSDPIAGLNLLAAGWAGAMERACWQGGLAIALVGALCRLMPRLPGRIQCWLWRLAYLKVCVALLWVVPLELPVLAPQLPVSQSLSGRAEGVGSARARARTSIGTEHEHENCPLTPMLLLFLLWLLGMGRCGAQVFGDWRRTQRLRTRGEAVRDEALIGECRAVCRQLGIRREPGLRTADDLSCPVLVGVARPAVVLPASFPKRFTPTQLRLMLAHELAHLQRRDLVWAWLPSLGRVLFFFHPLVWLAEGEWRLAHEIACDEQVLLRTGASQAGYGGMLLEVMGQLQPAIPAGLLSVSVAESYATVRRRLVAIRQIRAVSHRHWALATLLLAMAGIGGVVPWRLTAVPTRQHRPSGETAHRGSDPARYLARRGFQSAPSAPHASLKGWARHGERRRPMASLSLKSGEGLGARIRREQHRGATESLSSTREFVKDRSSTARRVMIAAALPTIPVGPSPDSASRTGSFDPPFAAAGTPDRNAATVFLMDKKEQYQDLSARDLDRAAFDKRMMDEKRMKASAMLLVPKPVVVPSALFGWETSPLFRSPKLLTIHLNRTIDPGELKRMLGEACQKGVINPEDAQKMLSAAIQEGGIDPRALKKLLAQAHREEDDAAGLLNEKRMPPLGKKPLFYQALDQQKREIEKQPSDKEPNGKPFIRIDADF
jgi:beta-lactamase regulating signal transducer with metallopeptidase domain